jgi:hypothetical protein
MPSANTPSGEMPGVSPAGCVQSFALMACILDMTSFLNHYAPWITNVSGLNVKKMIFSA